jgi:ElaB/YqjD/DUF883 family membrane-anchored ribosome-binding protein
MNEQAQYLDDLKQELNQYKKQLSTIKDNFKKKTNGDTTKVYDSLKNIVSEAGEAFQQLEKASAAEWEPLKKIASSSFTKLNKAFEDYTELTTEQLKEYSQEAVDISAEYVKNNPIKSILLAAGLGFIIGRVLK